MNTNDVITSKYEWRKTFSSENNIKDIFKSIGVENIDIHSIQPQVISNKCRGVLLVTLLNKDTNILESNYIDYISGVPEWQQFMDATFGIGADCDRRIIISDNIRIEDDIYYDEECSIADGYARICNDCAMDTYLVACNIKETAVHDNTYNLIVKPEDKHTTEFTKLPPKAAFDQAEFYIKYCQTLPEYSGDIIFRPDDWFGNYWHLDMCDVVFVFPIWNENGLFFEARTEKATGVLSLKWLENCKMDFVSEIFKGYESTRERISGASEIMRIKIWDEPFSDFTNTSLENKANYVEYIRELDYEFFGWIDEFYSERPSDSKIIDMLPKEDKVV